MRIFAIIFLHHWHVRFWHMKGRESPYTKIWKLYDLVEACTAYQTLILISLLHQKIGEDTPKQLKRANIEMSRTHLGKWRYALEKLPGGVCASMNIQHPLVRKTQSLYQRNKSFLAAINEERNQTAHDGPQSEETCSQLLSTYDPDIQKFLHGVRAINKDFYLVRVNQITKDGEKI